MSRHGHGVFKDKSAEMARGASVLLSVLLLGAFAPAGAQENPGPKWGPYIDLEAKPGTRRNLGEINYFIPLAQDDRTLYFSDLRGRFGTGGSQEGNFGLGMRRMLEDGWNVGGYGYLDRRRSELGNYFSQATLGMEALGRDWDFRGNAYIPMGAKSHSLGTIGGAPTASLSGTTIQIINPGSTTWEERALQGYDLEAGWRAPLFEAADNRQLRIYLGGYHFSAAGATVSGPRARLELTLDKLPFLGRDMTLSLSAETQHDSARGGQSFLGVRLRIPLEAATASSRKLSPRERRMSAPIVRDVDVVTQRRATASTPATTETAVATMSGQAFTVVDSATTSGAALQAALNAAGSNSMVILSGTYNTANTISIQTGQAIVGGGAITVRAASGQTATLNLASATISSTGHPDAVSMANNSTLSGMTIINNYNGGAATGVNAQSRVGVTIKDNIISVSSDSGVFAVDLRASTNSFLVGNTITAASTSFGAVGLYAQAAHNLTVSGNTFTSLTSGPAYAIAGDSATSFASHSTGNVATGATTCNFIGGTPSGLVEFSTISCP
jgi:hypothetical protein